MSLAGNTTALSEAATGRWISRSGSTVPIMFFGTDAPARTTIRRGVVIVSTPILSVGSSRTTWSSRMPSLRAMRTVVPGTLTLARNKCNGSEIQVEWSTSKPYCPTAVKPSYIAVQKLV